MISRNLQATIAWYDEHAAEYAQKIESKIQWMEIKQFVNYLSPNSYVLDAGCAAGRDSQILSSFGLEVIGVDLSQKLIELAREKLSNIEFVKADLLDLPFENSSFDGIWASASLVHLETKAQVKRVLVEFERVLKHDGILYLCVQNRGEQRSSWAKDVHSKEGRFFQFLKLAELKSLVMTSGLEVVDAFERKSSRPGIDWSVVYSKKSELTS